MRDTRSIESHLADVARKNKKKQLHKDLRKEVEVGANGTQQYVIKEGINKNKVANTKNIG
jgi:hypothetical protein